MRACNPSRSPAYCLHIISLYSHMLYTDCGLCLMDYVGTMFHFHQFGSWDALGMPAALKRTKHCNKLTSIVHCNFQRKMSSHHAWTTSKWVKQSSFWAFLPDCKNHFQIWCFQHCLSFFGSHGATVHLVCLFVHLDANRFQPRKLRLLRRSIKYLCKCTTWECSSVVRVRIIL